MFHKLRGLHRWCGIFSSLFLVVLSLTGLLLSVKKRFGWIQPPSSKGSQLASMAEVAPIGAVAEAVFRLEIAELRTREDFYRFELHADKNLFKVMSKEGYHEVQLDAKTAKVLSVGKRNDNLIESLHDLSWFGEPLHDWVLPLAALSLFALGTTGVYMFSVPVVRRWRFKRGKSGRI